MSREELFKIGKWLVAADGTERELEEFKVDLVVWTFNLIKEGAPSSYLHSIVRV